MEARIAEAEVLLQTRVAELEDPAIATDAQRLQSAQDGLEEAQRSRDALYERWAELEEKNG